MANFSCFGATILIFIASLFSCISYVYPPWSIYPDNHLQSRLPGIRIEGTTTTTIGAWEICRYIAITGNFQTLCATTYVPYTEKDDLGNMQSYPSICTEWNLETTDRSKMISYFLGQGITLKDGISFFDKTCLTIGKFTHLFSIIQMTVGLFTLACIIISSCCCQNHIIHCCISIIAVLAGFSGIIASCMHASQRNPINNHFKSSVSFALNTIAGCFFLLASFLLGSVSFTTKKKIQKEEKSQLV